MVVEYDGLRIEFYLAKMTIAELVYLSKLDKQFNVIEYIEE